MTNKSVLLFFSVGVIGGAETNFVNIARELNSRGFKIYLCIVKDNGPLLSLLHPYITDYAVLDFAIPFKLPNIIIRYKKFLAKNNIYTVLNFGLKVELFSRVFSKPLGAKFIISNIRSTDDWRKWYHVLLDRITQYNVDLWVSNSEAGKRAFIKREKIKADKCLVIYNYVEDEIKPLKQKILPANIRIGILSNIKKGKGFEDLIGLARLLDNDGIEFKFVIAGRDLMNKYFQKLVSKEQLEHSFEFLGYVKDKAVFFNNIDLFVLPTYVEGLPTSILEAMSYGVPVISTNVGGIPEMIIHQYNGYLTTPGNVDAFFNAIKILIHNKSTFDEYRKMAHCMLREKFVKSKVICQWVEILQ